METKKVYSNDDALVFVCSYTVLMCFILVVLLWCRPNWWGSVGVHYYEKPFCQCSQCLIVSMSEEDLRGTAVSWRFE